jgi:hypothetical protein
MLLVAVRWSEPTRWLKSRSRIDQLPRFTMVRTSS